MKKKVLLRIQNLKVWYPLRRGFLFGKPVYVHAVDGISFDVYEGEIFGLVGESGCGKTTTGKALVKLVKVTDGKVFFFDDWLVKTLKETKGAEKIQTINLDGQEGVETEHLRKDAEKLYRRRMQMIFQDPYESLNPRFTVEDTIAEPLLIHGFHDVEERVYEALRDVGLVPPEDFMFRYPHELSGGQRQRVAIARALVIRPKFVVADEPVSMLDASLRAGIMNLMLDLREKFGLTYIFITHDLSVARYMTDRLAVMYLGKIVEIGETEKVIQNPKHPYSRALISAVPTGDPFIKRERMEIKGGVPTPINPPKGCRFVERCPFAEDVCREQEPKLVKIEEEHLVACHLIGTGKLPWD